MPERIGTAQEIDMEALIRLGSQLGLSNEVVAEVLGINVSTFWRWRSGEASPRGLGRSRVAQFMEFGDMLRRQFAGPDLAREWLKTSRPQMLGGEQAPLDVLREGRIDRVLTLLHFMASGA